MAAVPKRALKIRRVLRTAARLPARVSGGRGSGRNNMSPGIGELPVVLLRVQIQGCKDLISKDKNGLSDPFVAASFARNRNQTPVAKKTINPSFPAKDSTFEFPIYLSLADKLGVLELVVWDKDMIKKDYLGEAALSLEDWFKEVDSLGFDDQNNMPICINLLSTRASTHASGTIQVKVGFVLPQNADHTMTFEEIYNELVRRSRHADISLVSAPPTEGIGTIRSHQAIPDYEDDGLSSDEGEMNSEDEEDEAEYPPYPPPLKLSIAESSSTQFDQSPPETPSLPEQSTPTSVMEPSPAYLPVPKPLKSPKFPKMFPRRPSMTPRASHDSTMSTMSQTSTSASDAKKKKFRKSWGAKKKDYNFNTANDIMGIVLLEIQRAEDLPKILNRTRTRWDMDPFIVVSFGKKVFRTRVIRHSLNPVWDEKMLFHVRRYESAFKVQLTVLDWDKLTSNDYVGDASFDVAELLRNAPQPDETTGLYPESVDGGPVDMQEFKLPVSTTKERPWESKHNPILTVKAKYQPYGALRQRFWRQYLKQYDTDDLGRLSRIEITSMLDSLGSTLSHTTIDSFFTRWGKRPDEELTVAEVIICLEAEVCRPPNEKKRIEYTEDGAAPDSSALATPMLPGIVGDGGRLGLDLTLQTLDFSGAPVHPTAVRADASPSEPQSESESPRAAATPPVPTYPTEPSQQPLRDAAARIVDGAATRVPMSRVQAPGLIVREASSSSSDADAEAEESSASGSGSGSGTHSGGSADSFERVINIKNCPLCHRPRLTSKAERDIVTHLAVCASQDWARVDRIVVGNFVTASQAQRKWYTKVISKVSSGDYRLGANSANIIVQNRMTGKLEEEKMQVYIRLGIRLLYKGAKSRMEGARARRLLKSLSIKQGLKYDSPESAREIPAFIEFHNLNVDELLDPLSSFKTFNQFFYRKLKPSARPVESPDDPMRLVSAADCRMMAFETVNEATRLWIKGREFTVARLLGDAYRDQVERYTGGALAVFRLAPQDYHRFHSPVDGTIGSMTYIAGEYYTVNPQAVRTALDVYGENARKIVPIDSPSFGRVMMVCVGAMMVGSIKTTVVEGEEVRRGQEIGYFAFGGSTIVALFERGAVEWDEDLLINGRASLETLVRVGMGVGRGVRHSAHSHSHSRSHSYIRRPKTPSPAPLPS